MREFENAAELAAAVGEELGVSNWFTIGQERIDRFVVVTKDD